MQKYYLKRLCAIVLIVAIISSVLSASLSAVADGDYIITYDYDNFDFADDITISTVVPAAGKTLSGHIIIPERSTEGLDVVNVTGFQELTSITSVSLPSTVKNIANNAFENCTGLETIYIPKSIEYIGSYAFNGCEALKNIIFYDTSACFNGTLTQEDVTAKDEYILSIPDGVTIGCRAFRGCESITELYLGAEIQMYAGAFLCCRGLTEVHFKGDVFNLPDDTFAGCSSLETVELKGVCNIGMQAFNCCYHLKNINLPDNLKTIGFYAFASCYRLENLNIPKNVSFIDNSAFKWCDQLSSITVDSCNETYRSEGNCIISKSNNSVVLGCENSIIPSGVKSIGDNAFFGRGNFDSDSKKEIVIPEGVTTIGRCSFADCEGITDIKLPSTLTTIGEYAFDRTGLASVRIPSNVTEIDKYAFWECHNLREVFLPKSVTKLGASIFDECENVTIYCSYDNSYAISYAKSNNINYQTVKSDDIVGISVKQVPDRTTYSLCDNLDTEGLIIEVIFDDNTTIEVTEGIFVDDYDFSTYGEKTITVKYLGESATFTVNVDKYIWDWMEFHSMGDGTCWVKKADGANPVGILEIPEYSPSGDKVISIAEYGFDCCWDLEGVIFPDSVERIGSYAFCNCFSLENIELSGNISYVGAGAFSNCLNLEIIKVYPENKVYESRDNCLIEIASKTLISGCESSIIPDDILIIGEAAFLGVYDYKNLVIPDSVTTIKSHAFSGCYALKSVELSKNVKIIENGAFSYCSDIESFKIDSENQFYEIKNNCLIEKSSKTLLADFVGSTLPNDVKIIGDTVFTNNNSIVDLVIPDGVTKIGCYSFLNCKNLTRISIPDSVTEIGFGVFNDCADECVLHCSSNNTYVITYAEQNGITYITDLAVDEHVHTGGTATCKDKAVCEVCEAEYGELDATNHTGNTEIRNYKAPTCTEEGYTGDTYCKDCGEKLSEGEPIAKVSHTISEYKVTKEATTTEAGEKTGICSVCKAEFKTEIAKLTSAPISEEQTEFKGMEEAPKLVPAEDTVLPENVVFKAEQKSEEALTVEEKAEVQKAVEALEENIEEYVDVESILKKDDDEKSEDGEEEKTEVKVKKVDFVCVLSFDLIIPNVDKTTGESLGEEEYHFDGSVTVAIPMPAEMKTAKNPCIIHIKDDGTCENVPFTVNDDGTISITVTSFSSFVVVDVEVAEVKAEKSAEDKKADAKADDKKAEESPAANATPSDKVVKTGDSTNMYIWIVTLVVSFVGIMVLVKRRFRKAR